MGSNVADAFNVIVAVLERGQKNGLFNLDEAGEIYNSLKILQPIVQNAHNAKNLNQSEHINKSALRAYNALHGTHYLFSRIRALWFFPPCG